MATHQPTPTRYAEPAGSAYRLRDRGHDLAVHTDVVDGHNRARLLVDGEPVAEATGDEIGSVRLHHGPHLVHVGWWWRGRVGSVDLVDAPLVKGRVDTSWTPDRDGWRGSKALRTPFEPPTGSRAHRTWAWRQDHPRLWAIRHVALQLLSLAVGVLGVSALVRWLLGWLPDWDLPSPDLPDWDLPDLFGWLPQVPPEWTPGYWIERLVAWVRDLLGFLPDGWGAVVPLVVAVVVAVNEVRRRRGREAREREAEQDREAGDGGENR